MPLQIARHGDVDLVVEVSGEGPTILLLHGWPDTARLWDLVVPRLVEAGFRVAAPDLRGCGRSSKPEAVGDYSMPHLVGDATAILDSLGVERATVVGHDWGGALAWATAILAPERVSSLVALSVGHPNAFRAAGLEQMTKSWYMLVFSRPGLGEAFLRYNDHEALRTWVRHPRVDDVIAELERDGQMSSHLHWYGANFRPDLFITPGAPLPKVAAPALGMWSTRDFALTERQMKGSASHCANGFTYVRVEGAGHWIPLEAPERVADEVIDFVRAVGA